MPQPVKTTRHLRAKNCRTILEKIHTEGPISAARLAEHCGLRPSTISNILKELREAGCIRYCGYGSSTHQGGKRPLLIELNADYGYLSGVEVSPRAVRIVIRDFSLAETYRKTIAWPLGGGAESIRGSMEDVVAGMRAATEGRPMLCVGVGVSGGEKSFPDREAPEIVREALRAGFGCEVIVEDHAGLAACGEWVMHEQRAAKDLVFIDVPKEPNSRTCVGVGLILNGRLYRGSGCAGRYALAPDARSTSEVGDILRMVADLLDPSLIVLRGASRGAGLKREGTARGPQVKHATFGEYAVAEGGVAHAFESVLDSMR